MEALAKNTQVDLARRDQALHELLRLERMKNVFEEDQQHVYLNLRLLFYSPSDYNMRYIREDY